MRTNSICSSEGVKPGNEARTRWRRGSGVREPVVLLYLHGFTASPGEAGDLPEQMADALGANLHVHRWPGHGKTAADAMRGLTLGRLKASAEEALARACAMGESVAIVGSSLGATLGLWLAATRPDDVAAVVAWSPGVQAADPALLDQFCLAQETLVDPRPRSAASQAYWSEAVHPDGFRALREMFRANAEAPPWPQVRCPVCLGYYYPAAPTARKIGRPPYPPCWPCSRRSGHRRAANARRRSPPVRTSSVHRTRRHSRAPWHKPPRIFCKKSCPAGL